MSRGHLLTADRRQRLAYLVERRRVVRVQELVELFQVSDETIRRDLTALEREGMLRKTHGAALALPTRHESDFDRRLAERQAEKTAIGQRAMDFVEDGSTVILDSGTTALQFAKHIGVKRDVLVVTNAITNVTELLLAPAISVVVIGGSVRSDTYDAVGDMAVANLRDLHVDRTFLTISSISVRGGLTYPRLEEVGVKRAMIDAASEVILLADSSKFGREALVHVAPINVLSRVITTPGVDPDTIRQFEEQGIEFIIAQPGPSD
jgi:DeoR/GlpR family transcriptional regulator of sugar metabolism